MPPSEEGGGLSRRSSSLNSHASSEGKKAKNALPRPRRSLSKSSSTPSSSTALHKHDPSLTSFPSFSPEQAASQTNVPKSEVSSTPFRTISQKVRDRKATLAGLTSASPSISHQNALFDDSPRSSVDIPGALHLASDEHISRLIARTGAVKLVRQFAQDLAQRDAEITALRNRADNRERELKKLLREADVPTPEIEKRLLRSEQALDGVISESPATLSSRKSGTTLDGMMNEAMTEEVGADVQPAAVSQSDRPDATQALKSAAASISSKEGSKSRPSISSKSTSNGKSSRANSMKTPEVVDAEATVKPRAVSSKINRLRGLDSLFQPPSQPTSYFIGGAAKSTKTAKAADEASIRSNQSSSSFTSWTKIFGGNSQSKKDETGRTRSSSLDNPEEDAANVLGSTAAGLTKNRTSQSATASRSDGSLASSGTIKGLSSGRKTPTTSRLSTSPNHARKESNASDFPPTVEMDSMIESSQLPPTMTTHNHEVEGLLTDRFGFIYDQRKRKRQNAAVLQHRKNQLSGAETLGSFRSERSDDDVSATATSSKTPNRPPSPVSVDEDSSKKSWQDYLKVSSTTAPGRPRELLSHTPSAGAIVTVNTADVSGMITPPSRTRASSISVSVAAQKAIPATTGVSQPKPSTVTATSADFGTHNPEPELQVTFNDNEPVRILLDQLKELHDTIQAEKTVKWNEFLRRVRAERATTSDRSTNNAPEAELLNGELIGIATLGRSNKTKSKYLHFKSLVLAGIPVSLRPKIWAECSGATTLRIPGYYDDLVARSQEGSDIDADIANQIKADIRRTLTDNTFFRYGPGVQRLEDLLRAYSLHNPRIGYCQGMNLITASLLLICATPEDCFWLLIAIIDQILPSGYFDRSLLVARADQLVLRGYVAEVLPKLDAKLTELGVELEACTFHWFLSLYTGVLTGGEALYRVWDVVLCLNSSDATPNALNTGKSLTTDLASVAQPSTPVPLIPADGESSEQEHDGTSSPFLFQLSLALLKLNETAILGLGSAAMVYSYINHSMTNHAISIDGLIQAAEGLRLKIQRADVLDRRRKAVAEISGEGGAGT